MIKIDKTIHGPEIIIDADKGTFSLSGRSIVADPISFYKPIFEWIETYKESPTYSLAVSFTFDYFNTASHKMLLQILISLAEIHKSGADIKVKWNYFEDDEDMLEIGEEAELLTGLPFTFECIPE